MTKSKADKIIFSLARMYPDARCGLEFKSPFQLLVSTILSAQTTDTAVNGVTPSLFRRYPDPKKLASAPRVQLETLLRPLGLARVKARNIKGTAAKIVSEHGSVVPKTMKDLLGLLGVGRKTASVVLGECFGTPVIVVDTHMGRVARRLGLTQAGDPEKVESDLIRWVPARNRTLFSHQAITHGRTLCMARRPECPRCSLSEDCGYYLQEFQEKA